MAPHGVDDKFQIQDEHLSYNRRGQPYTNTKGLIALLDRNYPVLTVENKPEPAVVPTVAQAQRDEESIPTVAQRDGEVASTVAQGQPKKEVVPTAAQIQRKETVVPTAAQIQRNETVVPTDARVQRKEEVVPSVAQIQRKKHDIPTVAQYQRDPESIPTGHKVMILSNPSSDNDKIWEGAKASYETAGSLHFLSEDLTEVDVPTNQAMRGSTVTVRVCIQGLKLNPSISTNICIAHSNQLVHRCQIEWPFHHIKHRGGPPKAGVTGLHARIDNASKFMEMSFVPECAVSSNLLPVLHDMSLLRLDEDTSLTACDIQLLTNLAEMVERPNGRRVRVRFNISIAERRSPASNEKQSPIYQLVRKLPIHWITHVEINGRLCKVPSMETPAQRASRVGLEFVEPRWKTYRRDITKMVSELGRKSPDSDSPKSQVSGSTDSSSDSSDDNPRTTLYGTTQATFDSMLTRHAVLSSPHPGTPVPSRMIFADQDDALVSLAYGAYLEYQEEAITANAIRRDVHSVRLCSVDSRVLALVDFSSPPTTGLPDDRFRLDDKTSVKLTIKKTTTDGDDDSNVVETKGLIVANVFKLPRCDLLILVTGRYAGFFRDMVSPIEHFQTGGISVPQYACRVATELNTKSVESEIKAVADAYGSSCAKHRLPFLLGDGSQLPEMPPTARVERTRAMLAFKTLRIAKTWNAQQRQAIESLRHAPGGSMIVTGPGGTGKTELIVHLIKFAAACGQHAIVSGTRNDTLDDMTLKIDKLDPALRPVRFYAPSQENLSSFYLGNDPRVSSTSANRLLVKTFDAIESDTKNSRRALPQFSVKGMICQNFKRGPLIKVIRPHGRHDKAGVRMDVRGYFKSKVPLLETNLHADHVPWCEGDEEKDRLTQVYRELRNEVLRDAKVILCTNAMSANKDIQYNFAFDKEVWVFQDEAQSMTESAALIPLSLDDSAKYPSARKVVMHFLSGDLKQLPPFVMSRDGEFNTVNEFAAQRNISLMERKLKSNYPAIALVEQRRAAEILMRGANIFHYGGKLVTPASYPPLSFEVSGLIQQLAGAKVYPRQSADRSRIAWLETTNPVYQNKFTGSRANPGNAALVRKCLFDIRMTYGKNTSAKVMLATPYKRQKELYLSIAVELKANYGWIDSEIPRIVTIDSLIGREASLVILDLVNDQTEGFLRDVRRACVAFTRAKDMFLVVGGSFPLPEDRKLLQPKTFFDPVNGKKIRADKSRPLAFFYSWFKANNFVTPANMSEIKNIPMPSDLCPIDEDLEDQEIAEEFVKEELLTVNKNNDRWEMVDEPFGSSKVIGTQGPAIQW